MASELCMNCFSVKGQYEVCPYCGYVEGTPPRQPHYLTPGTILGNHFIVGTVIGFGGFGITYKCFDTTLGVIVAVKEFYPVGLVNRSPGQNQVGLLSGDKKQQYREQLNRFLMEARSVAQFGKAKDIVNVYDYFEENGTAYIIMEYIDGVLLKDYLDKQGAVPPNVAMSIIMLIIEGVKKIHSKGIIHRDISPDNIFITDESSIKIFDFGAAQLNDSKTGMAGEKVIKVGYSAPEQYRDKSKQDFYTDIYSVGAIMYQMLTGRKPIESTEREHKDDLRSPLELGVSINSNIDRAVMEALAVKPELRFQGITQFEEALRSRRAAEYPKEKIRKRRTRRASIIAVSVLLVLAIGIGIGVTTVQSKNILFEEHLDGETPITIWVENEDQKELVESAINYGLQNKENPDGKGEYAKTWGKFWKENNEKITETNVVVKGDIQEALQNVSMDERPNMYITDHVSNDVKENLVSLKDVYDSLKLDEYAYMDQYSDYFKDYNEIPTGLDTLILYTCEIGYHKNNTLKEKTGINEVLSDEPTNTVRLDRLLSKDGYMEGDTLSNKRASFYYDANIKAMLLEDRTAWESCLADGNSEAVPNMELLSEIQSFNSVARNKNGDTSYAISRAVSGDKGMDESEESGEAQGGEADNTGTVQLEASSVPCGVNLVAGAGYRKYLEDILTDTSQKNVPNPLKGYETYVVTKGSDKDSKKKDEMLIVFSEKFGITKFSTKDQQLACERLIYVLLQERAQQEKERSNSETTFPIRVDQLKDFKNYKSNMASFGTLVENQKAGIIVGSLTGEAYQFAGKIGAVSDKEKLRELLVEYAQGSETEK